MISHTIDMAEILTLFLFLSFSFFFFDLEILFWTELYVRMNDLALERLHKAGWTTDRKVDISRIVNRYAKAGIDLPGSLREFFTSFGFLELDYVDERGNSEHHSINPHFGYSKSQLAHVLEWYNVNGMAYPVGSAFRDNMDILYHDDGNFYLFMGGGPVIRCGNSVESFFNGLIGEDNQNWENLDD